MLATKFTPEHLEGPSTSRSGHIRQRHIPASDKKFLPTEIIAIINNQNFWNRLYELQDILLPLCAALNKLQKDMARLNEVALTFGWIIKVFTDHQMKIFLIK